MYQVIAICEEILNKAAVPLAVFIIQHPRLPSAASSPTLSNYQNIRFGRTLKNLDSTKETVLEANKVASVCISGGKSVRKL